MTINISRAKLTAELLAAGKDADKHPFFTTADEFVIKGDKTKERDYVISGPTAKKFHSSKAAIRLLRGCVGCGKTTAAVRAIFAAMCEIYPDANGVRKSVMLVARETLPQLRTTTIPSFFDATPKALTGKWSSATNTLTYRFPLKGRNGMKDTVVESKVIFKSFPDTKSITTDLRGMQISALWVNECCTVPIELLTEGISRCGRYPGDIPKKEKKIIVICDTNSFDETDDHYQFWYNKDSIRKMAGDFGINADDFIETFDYPSGLSPEAENLEHLPENYYETLALTHANDQNWINVMIHNEFGSVRSGQPCYPSYDPATHVRSALANTALPLWIGADGGKDACCVVCQQESPGTVNVIDTFRVPERAGLQSIVEEMYRYLRNTYPPTMYKWITGAVDPGLQSTGQADNIQLIQFFHSAANRYGVGKVVPATTNNVFTRIETVDKYFSRNVDGRPAIILDKVKTSWLQRACSVYSWKSEIKRGVGRRFAETPEKSPESHIAEALQYALLRPGGDTRAVITSPDGTIYRPFKASFTKYKKSGLPTGTGRTRE